MKHLYHPFSSSSSSSSTISATTVTSPSSRVDYFTVKYHRKKLGWEIDRKVAREMNRIENGGEKRRMKRRVRIGLRSKRKKKIEDDGYRQLRLRRRRENKLSLSLSLSHSAVLCFALISFDSLYGVAVFVIIITLYCKISRFGILIFIY
jgi:hypothetical protein